MLPGQSVAAADGLVGWWDESAGTKKITHSSKLGQKKNVWLCSNFEFVLIEKISDL